LILNVFIFFLGTKNFSAKNIEFFPETWKDATPKNLSQ